MRNFIWDFDGTLFDTYTHTVKILYDYMSETGKHLDYDILYQKSRRSLTEARNYCNATDDEWREFYRREGIIDALPIALPYPNAEKVLQIIIENGCKNYIYTHRDCVMFKYLSQHNWSKYFSGFVTDEHKFPYKPSPNALLYMINRYNLNPNETIMIGDREIDVLSGKNAGIHSCLFTQGNTDIQYIQNIKNSKADYVAKDMLSLCSLFFPTVL